MSEVFSVRSERVGKLHRVKLSGELDMATAPVLEREFDDAGAADDDTVVVVDLADLTFMDSSGINLLLRLTDRFPTRLRVINGSPAVERLLDITGLRDRLPMISDDTDPFAPLQ